MNVRLIISFTLACLASAFFTPAHAFQHPSLEYPKGNTNYNVNPARTTVTFDYSSPVAHELLCPPTAAKKKQVTETRIAGIVVKHEPMTKRHSREFAAAVRASMNKANDLPRKTFLEKYEKEEFARQIASEKKICLYGIN